MHNVTSRGNISSTYGILELNLEVFNAIYRRTPIEIRYPNVSIIILKYLFDVVIKGLARNAIAREHDNKMARMSIASTGLNAQYSCAISQNSPVAYIKFFLENTMPKVSPLSPKR